MEEQKNEGEKKNNKNLVLIIIIILVICAAIGLYFVFTNDDEESTTSNETNTENSVNVSTITNDNTNSDPSISVVPSIVSDEGKYNYDEFMLRRDDMPEGYTLQSESATVIGGGSFDDGFVRFYQRMTYPEGTSKNFETPLNLTMQALIAENDTMLDKFQQELDTGSARIHSPFDDYETDSNYILGPAAWVRTDHAIFFLVSGRMDNWMSCEGADDCDTLATTGRSLNEDELNIMERYKILFEMYTGETQDEWTWSYVGYGNY